MIYFLKYISCGENYDSEEIVYAHSARGKPVEKVLAG